MAYNPTDAVPSNGISGTIRRVLLMDVNKVPYSSDNPLPINIDSVTFTGDIEVNSFVNTSGVTVDATVFEYGDGYTETDKSQLVSGFSTSDTKVYPLAVNNKGELTNAGYDSFSNSNQVTISNPEYANSARDVIAEVTNSTNGTYEYYIDMNSFPNGIGVHFEVGAATDSATLTVEASMQDDGTAASSCAFVDVTQYGGSILSAASTAANYTADAYLTFEKLKFAKWVKIKVVTAGGNNDADYDLYSVRL